MKKFGISLLYIVFWVSLFNYNLSADIIYSELQLKDGSVFGFNSSLINYISFKRAVISVSEFDKLQIEDSFYKSSDDNDIIIYGNIKLSFEKPHQFFALKYGRGILSIDIKEDLSLLSYDIEKIIFQNRVYEDIDFFALSLKRDSAINIESDTLILRLRDIVYNNSRIIFDRSIITHNIDQIQDLPVFNFILSSDLRNIKVSLSNSIIKIYSLDTYSYYLNSYPLISGELEIKGDSRLRTNSSYSFEISELYGRSVRDIELIVLNKDIEINGLDIFPHKIEELGPFDSIVFEISIGEYLSADPELLIICKAAGKPVQYLRPGIIMPPRAPIERGIVNQYFLFVVIFVIIIMLLVNKIKGRRIGQ